tara:strand:- start:4746 stop:5042 length:297 start_codon:yes stop_codon:yes gene_type:complete
MKELEEDCGCGHEEREGKMAKYSAIECAEDAMDIANMIQETDDLPEWLEAKITLASDYMNKVKDYMTHYVRGAESRPMHNKATDMTLKGVLKGALKGK